MEHREAEPYRYWIVGVVYGGEYVNKKGRLDVLELELNIILSSERDFLRKIETYISEQCEQKK